MYRDNDLKIFLCDLNGRLKDTWNEKFKASKNVEIYHGSIFDVGCQAIVSPANSFGFMDGGIDYLYTKVFGGELETVVRKKIEEEFDGELLVGQAILIDLSLFKIKQNINSGQIAKIEHIIIAPTMRVPMNLNEESVNPYLATKAALTLALKNDLTSIAFPGMGTGVGNISPENCARQMFEAVDVVINKNTFPPYSWMDAVKRNKYLYSGKF